MTEKPKTFISYAHKDSSKIAKRLAKALEPYCSEVFADWKLGAGRWKEQLAQKIMSTDFFLIIMSPKQSRSDTCQEELGLARKRLSSLKDGEHFEIVPIKEFREYEDAELEKLQYADFSGEFEEGFRALSFIIFNERRYSWEYLTSASQEEIVLAVKGGIVPAPIVSSACEQLIVDKVWGYLKGMVLNAQVRFSVGNPLTPEDVLVQIDKLVPQMAERFSTAGIIKLQKARKVVNHYIEHNRSIVNSDHHGTCQNAWALIMDINKFLLQEAGARFDAREIISIKSTYVSEVATALRKALKDSARNVDI